MVVFSLYSFKRFIVPQQYSSSSSSSILLGQHHELMAWSEVDWLHLLPSLRLKTVRLVKSMNMCSAVQCCADIYSDEFWNGVSYFLRDFV